MAVSIETLAEDLSKLIKKFEADRHHYLSKDYSEAQARIDFVTPFFKALGWDVENEAGLAHHEREVIVERGETEGRPDYNFRVAGQTKFFVEAKGSFRTSRHCEAHSSGQGLCLEHQAGFLRHPDGFRRVPVL